MVKVISRKTVSAQLKQDARVASKVAAISRMIRSAPPRPVARVVRTVRVDKAARVVVAEPTPGSMSGSRTLPLIRRAAL